MALVPGTTNVVNNPITDTPHRPHTDSELMLNNAYCLQARLQDVLYITVRINMGDVKERTICWYIRFCGDAFYFVEVAIFLA